MIQIAHLSDLHLLEGGAESAPYARRLKLYLLGMGRSLDVDIRKRRVLAALRQADEADHIVISGDLTEDGHPAQFEMLSDILKESGIAPSRITLVPGNHDGYTSATAVDEAFQSSLEAYSPPGTPIHLPGVTLMPISTSVHQHILSARGFAYGPHLQRVEQLALSSSEPLVVVQHHPPFSGWTHTLDGLQNMGEVSLLLRTHPQMHVLCGHTHMRHARKVHLQDDLPRVFCAPAVVEHPKPVTMYQVSMGTLVREDRAFPRLLAIVT